MAEKMNIKFVVEGVEYNRDVYISVKEDGATGNVFNGKIKTGFFRWNKGYKYPMFFSDKKVKVAGGQPINLAIAEAVRAVCAKLREDRKAEQPAENMVVAGVPVKTNTPLAKTTKEEPSEEEIAAGGEEW